MKRIFLFLIASLFYLSISAQTERPVAVLLGNSITESWPKFDAAFLTENHFVGKGISGQVSAQILARFQKDVLELQPQYVVILVGTNDVAQNSGWLSLPEVVLNIDSMCRLATAADIQPILCTLPPSTRYKWRPLMTHEYIRDQILELNQRITAYAEEHQYPLVDYYPLLSDADGNFLPKLCLDGVHPNLAGYKIMEQALLKVLPTTPE